MSNGEQFIAHDGVELCIETFGRRADPATLLIHGASASKLYWEAPFCERLAQASRFVIRFDNRDTGLSTAYPPGRPGYTLTDLAGDALAILDGLGIERAQIVAQSMAGATALVLAIDHPQRVCSLVLIATSPGEDDLPPMSPEFEEYTEQSPDYSDRKALEAYILGLMRLFSGKPSWFDEERMRPIVEQDVARTRSMTSALINPFMIDFDGPKKGSFESVTVPTLIIHGDNDPVFPLAHAERMRRRIAGSQLLVLKDTGHEIPPRHWDATVASIVGLSSSQGNPHGKHAGRV